MRAQDRAEVQAIDPVAVNQMIKAIIIARTYLYADQIHSVCMPSFTEVTVDGQPRAVVHLLIVRERCLCSLPNGLCE